MVELGVMERGRGRESEDERVKMVIVVISCGKKHNPGREVYTLGLIGLFAS